MTKKFACNFGFLMSLFKRLCSNFEEVLREVVNRRHSFSRYQIVERVRLRENINDLVFVTQLEQELINIFFTFCFPPYNVKWNVPYAAIVVQTVPVMIFQVLSLREEPSNSNHNMSVLRLCRGVNLLEPGLISCFECRLELHTCVLDNKLIKLNTMIPYVNGFILTYYLKLRQI